MLVCLMIVNMSSGIDLVQMLSVEDPNDWRILMESCSI